MFLLSFRRSFTVFCPSGTLASFLVYLIVRVFKRDLGVTVLYGACAFFRQLSFPLYCVGIHARAFFCFNLFGTTMYLQFDKLSAHKHVCIFHVSGVCSFSHFFFFFFVGTSERDGP
jgi:hypothetical protein